MRRAVVPALVVVALLVSGCAEESPAQTLASTKSVPELLRIYAAGLIPAEAIEFRETDAQKSESCSDDDEATLRAWKASIRFTLESDFAAESEHIAGDVVSELEAKGWKSDKKERDGTTTWALESATLPSTLQISAVGDPDGNGKGATIFIAATGPCVEASSAEVQELESKY